jgi:hypothetical protein
MFVRNLCSYCSGVHPLLGFPYGDKIDFGDCFMIMQAITKHFKGIRVTEKKTVPLFITMVKSHKSKLDQPKPSE